MAQATKRIAIGGSSVLILSLALAGAASAQSASDTLPASEAADDGFGDIVVTAQKRSERLIDVPASIAAITADQITSTGAQRLSDLGTYVPNVRIAGGDALAAAVYIRGIGSHSRNIGFDSRVGVYVDGVYLGQSPAVDQELLALERVEVLRGPQGALFGKNTVAGAINMVTRRPTDVLEVSGMARIGNMDLYQLQGSVSGPIAEGVDAGISVGYVKRDGFTHNVANGQTMGGRDALSYRGQLRVRSIDNLEIYATVDGLRGREVPYLGNPISNTFASGFDTEAPGNFNVALSRTSPDKRDLFGGSLEFAYTLPNDATIKSISSYRFTHFHTERDVDGSGALDVLYVVYDDKYRQYTEELQYISPKGERLEYVAGLFLYRQDGATYRNAIAGASGPATIGLPEGTTTHTDGTVRTSNYALFANATYEVADRLKFGFGFRLSHEEKRVNYNIDSSRAPSFGLATGNYKDKLKHSDFSPTVTLTYELGPSSNAYARYSTGYKSGGFNLDFVDAAIFPDNLKFGKETVQNYEAGVKLTLFDRRLHINADIFRADYDNYQISRTVELSGGGTAITLTNAGKVRSQGIEVEGTARPVTGLTLRGGIGLLDTKFTEYANADAAGNDYTGNRVPGAPEFTANAGFDFEHDLSSSLLGRASFTYSWQGSRYSDVANRRTRRLAGQDIPWDRMDGYGLVDARIAIGGQNGGWEVALWGRNLANVKYVTKYNREFLGTLYDFWGEPRTYGADLSFKF